MILDLSALYSTENRKEAREVHIDMEAFVSKLGVFPVLKSGPFVLYLTNVENRRLLIKGGADVTVIIPCDRCLAEVPTRIHLDIEKDIPIPRPGPVEEKGTALQEDDDNLEQSEYIRGCRLDADRLVSTELLAAWPMKVLCREDCKGICSKCGADLNAAACSCSRRVPDPRMAAFQDVFDKFKEV